MEAGEGIIGQDLAMMRGLYRQEVENEFAKVSTVPKRFGCNHGNLVVPHAAS